MPDLRERILYPRAGWLSLGLLVVMALALGWSVQGAEWLDQMEFLVPVALWAVVIGAVLGVIGGSIVVLLPLAAVLGAGAVVWTVGGEYHPGLDQVGRLLELRSDLIGWLVIVLDTGYPPQMSPYAVGLGALMFATAFTASYVVYRYHRVLDAILLLGAALITNMSATFTDLFGHLLLFVIAALLLWLRAALVNREDGWQRRRVNENLEVPASIMRSGIIFAGASVVLAWMLTSVAVAAPLTGAWRSFDGVWDGVREEFEGVFGGLTNPESRLSGDSFGSGFTVSGSFVSNDDEVLILAAPQSMYLRTVTYDQYTGRGFRRSEGDKRQVAPGAPLFASATTERPTIEESVDIHTITVQMRQTYGRNLFTAGSPLKVYVPTVIHQPSGQPVLGAIESANAFAPGDAYQASVAISNATEADLAAAGTDYPDEVRRLYLDTPGLTDRVAQLARDITAEAANPYQQAKLLERYLSRNEEFSYAAEAAVPTADQDLVDFFLFDSKTGYCEYYASAMVIMARSLGLPARVAVGFAPTAEDGEGTYTVREANAHAWAEIYFPGYGWQIFEATKSINPRFSRASGDASAPRPPQRGGVDPLLDWELEQGASGGVSTLPSFRPIEGGFDATSGDPVTPAEQARGGNAAVIFGLIGLGLVVAWLRIRHVQRRWRLMPAGDRAWRQLIGAAGRAGVGPRPSETIYEYAGWLEDQLPRQSEPIRTVADGKVWHAYSGRRMSASAGARLDAAIAQLRLPLIGLAIRRGVRRLLRRDERD
ncbi:MAG TPA: transglutaminaseTgpA domain-containing protein [Candidatus Limnocylindria bacterium]|nr:transglutaminaseTgpA domain-containing protein [Candidatus Limnocylindria bacterium]